MLNEKEKAPEKEKKKWCLARARTLSTVTARLIRSAIYRICFAFLKAAYSVIMNIFRKKNIFFLNHL